MRPHLCISKTTFQIYPLSSCIHAIVCRINTNSVSDQVWTKQKQNYALHFSCPIQASHINTTLHHAQITACHISIALHRARIIACHISIDFHDFILYSDQWPGVPPCVSVQSLCATSAPISMSFCYGSEPEEQERKKKNRAAGELLCTQRFTSKSLQEGKKVEEIDYEHSWMR